MTALYGPDPVEGGVAGGPTLGACAPRPAKETPRQNTAAAQHTANHERMVLMPLYLQTVEMFGFFAPSLYESKSCTGNPN